MTTPAGASPTLLDWIDRHVAGGPPTLVQRVRDHAVAAQEVGLLPERLSVAAERVLSIVEEHPGHREIALDLLAADALITLALLAQSQANPGALAGFAEGILAGERV
jgi:hypothetical protein